MVMGERDMEMVNVHYLTMLQHAWIQTAAAKEQSGSKRGFLQNSISPNTELTGGGGGIGSRKSSYTVSVPETFDAPENHELFGSLDGQDDTQLLRGAQI